MKTLMHEFVEYIPGQLDEGVIYVSMEYRLAVHKCVCGCGKKVITPFSPTDWELRFYGETISLSPSIGNWNFECRSHYWIIKNQVKHAGDWNDRQVENGRARDKERKKKFYTPDVHKQDFPEKMEIKNKSKPKWLEHFFGFLGIN